MKKKAIYVLTLLAIISVFAYVNIVNADVVQKGLVAYWSFDTGSFKGNTAVDIVGGNDGELNGKPKAVAGKIGQALEFDGTNSVDVAGTNKLNFNGVDEMTAAAWFNAKSDDPVVGIVAGCCGSIVAQRDANGWALRYDGRNGGAELEFIVCPGWQGDNGFGAPKVKPGEWHYITGVVAKTNMYLYLDGELVKEGAFAGPISSTGPETDIGKAGDGGFIGIIDEVVIYNRALDKNEIKQNYETKVFKAVKSMGKLATCWGDLKR